MVSSGKSRESGLNALDFSDSQSLKQIDNSDSAWKNFLAQNLTAWEKLAIADLVFGKLLIEKDLD